MSVTARNWRSAASAARSMPNEFPARAPEPRGQTSIRDSASLRRSRSRSKGVMCDSTQWLNRTGWAGCKCVYLWNSQQRQQCVTCEWKELTGKRTQSVLPRHEHIGVLLHQRTASFQEPSHQLCSLVHLRSKPKPHICGHLVVSAAARVQLARRRPDQLRQPPLVRGVDVFVARLIWHNSKQRRAQLSGQNIPRDQRSCHVTITASLSHVPVTFTSNAPACHSVFTRSSPSQICASSSCWSNPMLARPRA